MTHAASSPAKPADGLFPPLERAWPEVLTVLIAVAGGTGFVHFGVAGGAISGAMLCVALASAFGLAAPVSLGTRIIAMAVSGLSVGSAASPETVQHMITYPASIALMALAVVSMTAASATVSMLVSRWAPMTALLSAVPGGMSYVLSLAMSPGVEVDVPQVVVVQAGRLLFLVALVPLIIVESGTHLAPLAFTETDPYWMVALMLPFTGAAGYLFHRFRVAGGVMFGALLVSALFHATGIAPGRAPVPVMMAGQILIGAWAGSRFVGFDWKLLLRSLRGVVGAIASAMLVAVTFAAIGAHFLDFSFPATLLAYAPGGLEAMTMLAFGLNVDPLFVAAHHFARVIVINLAMPVVVRMWAGRKPG